MTRPLVSVVMVVYNVDRFLAEAIESILRQTFEEFEFVIVDFGSTDTSNEIEMKYAAKDKRVKLHNIPHCSLADARNVSCLLAQGKYLAIMDADDIALSDRLALEVDFMERNPEVGVVGGGVEWIDATGQSLLTAHHPADNHDLQSALLRHCPLWQPTVLIRSEAFSSVGGYRKAFDGALDYDLWLRIAERFQIRNLNKVLLKYRIHPYQVSMRKRTKQALSVLAAQVAASSRRKGMGDPLSSLEEITPEVLATFGVARTRQQRELIANNRTWIRHMCMAGEYGVALTAALDALRSDLESVERWQIADLHLTVAFIYWRQTRLLSSLIAAAQAVFVRPVVVGRPVKQLLHRLGLV